MLNFYNRVSTSQSQERLHSSDFQIDDDVIKTEGFPSRISMASRIQTKKNEAKTFWLKHFSDGRFLSCFFVSICILIFATFFIGIVYHFVPWTNFLQNPNDLNYLNYTVVQELDSINKGNFSTPQDLNFRIKFAIDFQPSEIKNATNASSTINTGISKFICNTTRTKLLATCKDALLTNCLTSQIQMSIFSMLENMLFDSFFLNVLSRDIYSTRILKMNSFFPNDLRFMGTEILINWKYMTMAPKIIFPHEKNTDAAAKDGVYFEMVVEDIKSGFVSCENWFKLTVMRVEYEPYPMDFILGTTQKAPNLPTQTKNNPEENDESNILQLPKSETSKIKK